MTNWISNLVKYGTVGSIGMVLDFGLTWILREKVKINEYLANGIGFLIAVSNNYVLNKYWTFGETTSINITEFSIFLCISIVGISLNSLLLYIFHKFLGVKFYWAKLVATGLVFLWNFMANDLITFKS